MSAIENGTTLPGGFVVSGFLGTGPGDERYAAHHEKAGPTVIHVLHPALIEPMSRAGDVFQTLRGVRHRSLQRFYGHATAAGRPFLAWQQVAGASLAEVVAGRDASGGRFAFGEVVSVLGHVSAALDAVHAIGPHGGVSLRTILLAEDGAVVLTEPSLAWLALVALSPMAEPFVSDPCVAPEIRDDAWATSEGADYYALGMVAVSLLTTVPATRDNVAALRERIAMEWPSEVTALVDACVSEEPGMRVASGDELRALLVAARDAVEVARAANEAPPEPEEDDDPFADLIAAPSAAADDDPERWLVHREGRDYGPYTAERVREMLLADEIDEHTPIHDSFTGDILPLVDVPTFTDDVLEYLPVRAKKRIAAEERREKVVGEVKRTGRTTLLLSTFAVIVVAVLGYLARPKFEPVLFDVAFVPVAWSVQPPQPDYQGIAADEDLLAALFDPSEPVPDPPPTAAGSTGTSSAGAAPAGTGDDDIIEEHIDEYVLRLDSSEPSFRLTSAQINETVRQNLGRVRPCFDAELRENPRFAGATVNWSINPDGRTFNVSVSSTGRVTPTGERCLVRAFQRIRFPRFNDVPMSVSFPFNVQ